MLLDTYYVTLYTKPKDDLLNVLTDFTEFIRQNNRYISVYVLTKRDVGFVERIFHITTDQDKSN